jgi:hypothetical protein
MIVMDLIYAVLKPGPNRAQAKAGLDAVQFREELTVEDPGSKGYAAFGCHSQHHRNVLTENTLGSASKTANRRAPKPGCPVLPFWHC